jgi:hypothetical protein
MDEEGYIKVSGLSPSHHVVYYHSPNVAALDHGKIKGPHNPGRREYCTASPRSPHNFTSTTNEESEQHPVEIENCLLSHPSVIEASVVGLKDERYGEVVAVFVRKDESKDITPDEVRDWVREKLSHHLGSCSLALISDIMTWYDADPAGI